jgi:putative oxidoreductase
MTTIQTVDQGLASAARGRNLSVALWVLQILVAVAFLAAGSGKLLGTPETIALFDAVGIGQWFRYVTGILEVVGALLLLFPGLAAFGAVLLAVVMTGASVSHLTVLDAAPTVPLVLLALTAVIVWGRRSQLASLLGS